MMKHLVKEYVTPDGKCPFREWLVSLDAQVKARIQARIFRFELGNLGDHKTVGKGVWEARIQFGPGYRVYFGKEEGRNILLLFAGDKSTQSRDIKKAQGIGQTIWKGMKMAKRSVDWNEGLAKDLQDLNFAREFLLASLAEGISIQLALGKVIRAMGVKEFSKKSKIASPNILRAINPKHNPTQDTLNRLLKPFGLKLTVAPIEPSQQKRHAA